MKILVTGGAGFIGINLTRSLIENGYDVFIFDNFSNSLKNFNFIINPTKITKGDITNYDEIFKCIKNIDLVIHLAAKIGVSDSTKNPHETNHVNVEGTLNVLQACSKQNVKNIICISTAAVYGDPKIIPITENSDPNPISSYGQSKFKMENTIINFSKDHGINSIILRLFNVYGPNQSKEYAGVITNFLDRIKENKSLTIYGDGSNIRDFIHVDDVVEAINLSIKNIQNKQGECYNICTETPITIVELARLMLDLSEKELELQFEPERKADIHNSCGSYNKAKFQLDFKPKVLLKDGLKDLIFNT